MEVTVFIVKEHPTVLPDSPPDKAVCGLVLVFGLMGVTTLLINLANNNFTE